MKLDDHRLVLRAFEECVNMDALEIERWLETPESASALYGVPDGTTKGGCKSGRRIVELLRKSRENLTLHDYSHMRCVVHYIERHLARRPRSGALPSLWLYELKNWGHDPVRALESARRSA